MSDIAGIDTGIDTLVLKEVSIPQIRIVMRYRKVLIHELGIEKSYLKVPIPGRDLEIGYRYPNLFSIPNFSRVKSIIRSLKVHF